MRGFYFITDAALSCAGNVSDLKHALAAGVRVVQYREKQAGVREMLAEARTLKALCHGALFLVNDRVDIALAVDAHGVHLGQEDLPLTEARRLLGKNKIIGITVRSVPEALEAQRQGADYLGVSSVYATRTKPDAGEPTGPELIREISKRVSIPLAAIGGLTLSNAPEVIGAGANLVCAISQVVTKGDVRREIEKFQALFRD